MAPQLPESNTDWQELEKQLFMRTFARLPVTLVRGQGALVWDTDNKEYLDFVGGWAVTSLGHCHPVIVDALTEQAKTLLQVSNQFYTIPQLQLADLLIKNSCMDRIFFCNSGAEANEGAIKLVRKYGKLHLNGAYQIITTHDSFHGRTLATVAATGQIKYQEPYIPLPNGFINVDYNDVDAIKQATSESTCAIMIEPIQGEGGVNVPDASYMKAIRDWCDQKGLVLILDEVQTGIGRIGTLFGYEQFGIEPDIMTLAKGLGSGVPIGAILAKEKASVFSPGDHGSTFGGNPLVCAVAYAALKYIIEHNVSEQVAELGDYFIDRLTILKSKFKNISGIRGRGLLLALVFTNDIAQDIVKASLEKGLLINQVKPNAIRFMPPLIITKKDIDRAINILEEVLGSR